MGSTATVVEKSTRKVYWPVMVVGAFFWLLAMPSVTAFVSFPYMLDQVLTEKEGMLLTYLPMVCILLGGLFASISIKKKRYRKGMFQLTAASTVVIGVFITLINYIVLFDEINANEYEEMAEIVEARPSVQEKYAQYLSDDKVTKWEFVIIAFDHDSQIANKRSQERRQLREERLAVNKGRIFSDAMQHQE